MRYRFGLGLGLALILGLGFLTFGLLTPAWYVKVSAVILGAATLLPGLLIVTWLFRANFLPEPELELPAKKLKMETWVVVDDGAHNAFTDMLFWRGYFWLVFISSPSHFASEKSRMVLSRSCDARNWQVVRKFDGAGQDIRDPKLGIIRDQLFLYALLNQSFDPVPYKTIAAHSQNGLDWSKFEAVTPDGWLLGRPVGLDGTTWYAPAHRTDVGSAVLLRSTDGVNWLIHSEIFAGKAERADETALMLLNNGSLLAVTRFESGSSIFGSDQAATLISTAAAPFTTWLESARSSVTRLDGPVLFKAKDQVFAVGRRQPNSIALQSNSSGRWTKQGSAFSRKRTALFHVDKIGSGLTHLADLPSSGDTAYAGVVVKDERVFISYYTNDPRKDYPWILGMLLPSRIQITMFDLTSLALQEDEK